MAKKNFISYSAIALFCAIAIMFASCNKSSGDSVSEKDLIGLWTCEQSYIGENGSEENAELDSEFFEGGLFEDIYIYYNGNGTAIANYNVKGNYSIEDGKIIYSVKDKDVQVWINEWDNSFGYTEAELKKEVIEGYKGSEKIVSFKLADKDSDDSDELVLQDSDGEITTYYRE